MPSTLKIIEDNVDPCVSCRLHKGCKSPKMPMTGKGIKNILILGEAPGAEEDKKNMQFCGESGDLLKALLKKAGLTMREDCKLTNTIMCRPPDNRNPAPREIKYCSKRLKEQIAEYAPKVVLALGNYPLLALLNEDGITKFRGNAIPQKGERFPYYILPTFHPSFLLRQGVTEENIDYNATATIVIKDFLKAKELAEDPYIRVPEFGTGEILTDPEEIIHRIECISDIFAFDYETYGDYDLSNAEVVTVSIVNDDDSFVFPYQWKGFHQEQDERDIGIALKELLEDHEVRKIAQNMKYEHMCSRKILDTEVTNWFWDTMLGGSVLDERKGTKSLEHMGLVNFGLKWKDKVDTKNIYRNELRDVLLYNLIDSEVTWELAWLQIDQLEREHRLKSHNFMLESHLCFADIETGGVNIDIEELERLNEKIVKRRRGIVAAIHKHPASIEFRKRHSRFPQPTGEIDLRELLYDIEKLPVVKRTIKQALPSTDKEALELNKKHSKLCKYLLDLSAVEKTLNTYISGLQKVLKNNRIYPQYNMHIAVTKRSSSKRPNFQNFTKHEKLGRQVRRVIIPEIGHILLEADYASAEVRVIAMYSHDPILMQEVIDGTDFHREFASLLFGVEMAEVTKDERQNAKNKFVFPTFYGSYFEQTAEDLGLPIDHVKEVEKYMWEKYEVVKEWQTQFQKEYYSKGYIEFFLGFRRYGPMKRTEIVNTPIQGTSYHLLQHALNKINALRKKERWESLILGQIHDSILFSVLPDEKDYIMETVERIMVTPDFDFVNVPLAVDFTEGANWEELSKK